jgi:glycosyltransferase involved in cell wall biosynthesis
MVNEYKFSFCIVTCNQPRELERLLSSLIFQDLDSVEIIIRDDSIDDQSKLIVDEYLHKIDIEYYHLEANGVDVAIQYVVKKAKGEYIWIFGDDVLELDAFKKVKIHLKDFGNLDFIYLNSSNLNKDQTSIKERNNIVTDNKDEFLTLIKNQLGFLSALIFKKEIIKTAVINDETVVGTHWIILYSALYAIVHGERFLYLSDIYFYSDDNKPIGVKRWYDCYEVLAIRFAREVVKFKDDFSPGKIRSLISFQFNLSWKAVLIERALGFHEGFASHTPKFKKTLTTFWTYPACYIALFLFILPRGLISYFYRYYKKIRVLKVGEMK